MKTKYDLEIFYGFYYNPWELNYSTLGFIVFENKKVINKQSQTINIESFKDFTKHILSYKSLAFCLKFLLENAHKDKKLAFYTNSLVVNRQLQCRTSPEKGEHIPAYEECIKLIKKFKNPKFGYISRKLNDITINFCKNKQKEE